MYKNNNSSQCVANMSLTSHNFFDIQQKIKGSLINKLINFDDQWNLQRAFNIDNRKFSREFTEKRNEFQKRGTHFSQWEIRYGFLATIKENMIYKVAEEGLEIRLCPHNYFGHNISGIHISQNADACLNEASRKMEPDQEIILIVFKYMLGRHKIVHMFDPNVLIAPSPNFDSHLCEERPDPDEKINNQYIKSLIYLYEFENSNFDPTARPRQCCPVSAMVYKQSRPYQSIDLTVSEPVQLQSSIFEDTSAPIYQSTSHWGREFLLQPTIHTPQSIVIQKNEIEDSRKVLVSDFNGSTYSSLPGNEEARVERWEPIQHNFYNRYNEDVRDRSVLSRIGRSTQPGPVEEYLYPERDRSVDRSMSEQWRGLGYGNYGRDSSQAYIRFPVTEFDGSSISSRNWFQ